jgi:hypothetical protein
MPRSFVVEGGHVNQVLRLLDDYVGLEHICVRKRDDLLILESGPKDDVVPHTRLRRIGVNRWQIEMPMKDGGWDPLPISIQLDEALDIVINELPWMLAPRH